MVEMPFDKVIYVIEQCREMCRKLVRLPYFFITGGDPILHTRFWEILEYLHEFNIGFSILGNPFHLTDEVCKRLHDLGCETYQLSIDGMRETHDMIRKPGSFDTTIEKIRVLKRNGVEASIMTTVSGTNKEELPDIINTVVEHGADSFNFARYCPTSQEKSTHLTPDEYRDLLDKVWRKFEEHKDKGTIFGLKDHLWKLFLYEKGLFKLPEEIDEEEIYDGCHCTQSHITILPTGKVMACRRFENTVGNVFKENLIDIFKGEHIDRFRHLEKFEKCSNCKLLRFCRGCPAVAYGYTHDFYSADPQCWRTV